MVADAVPSPFAEAVRGLYSGDFDSFVTERTRIAKSAAAAGDRAAAAAIKKLRKPSRAAWLLNLVAAEVPDTVQRVRDLGERLADAHRCADPGALRELSGARRSVLDAALRDADAAAKARGWQATSAVLAEAGETLQAALADPVLGERIAAGALVGGVRAAGFGPVDLFVALAPVIPLHPRTPPAADDSDPPDVVRAQLAAAESDLDRARDEADRALHASREVYAELRRVEDRSDELSGQIAELGDRLAALESEQCDHRRRLDQLRAEDQRASRNSAAAAETFETRQQLVTRLRAQLGS